MTLGGQNKKDKTATHTLVASIKCLLFPGQKQPLGNNEDFRPNLIREEPCLEKFFPEGKILQIYQTPGFKC